MTCGIVPTANPPHALFAHVFFVQFGLSFHSVARHSQTTPFTFRPEGLSQRLCVAYGCGLKRLMDLASSDQSGTFCEHHQIILQNGYSSSSLEIVVAREASRHSREVDIICSSNVKSIRFFCKHQRYLQLYSQKTLEFVLCAQKCYFNNDDVVFRFCFSLSLGSFFVFFLCFFWFN